MKVLHLSFILLFFIQISSTEPICGEMSDRKLYCFEKQNSFSDTNFFKENQSTIFKSLNNWLLDWNEGATKFEVLPVNNSLEPILLMNKREKVRKEETLLKVKASKTLNSQMFEPEMYKASTNILKDYTEPIPFLGQMSERAKLILGLLHHLYHIESSPFKLMLRALDFSSYPYFMTISQDLFTETLEGDTAYEEILEWRNTMMRDWESTHDYISQWPAETRHKILNNRDNITRNDWISVFKIVLGQTWNISNVLYLVPGANFAKYSVKIESLLDFNALDDLFNETHIQIPDKSLFFLAQREILYETEIPDNFNKFGYVNSIFLYNLKEENPSGCVDLNILEKTWFDLLESKEKTLISAVGVIEHKLCFMNFEYSYKRLKAFGNIMNMSPKEFDECYEIILENSKSNLTERIDLVLEKCEDVKWKFIENVEESIFIKEIKKTISGIKEKIIKCENFIKKYSSIENYEGNVIKFYLEKKLEIANKLEDYLRNLLQNENAKTMREDWKSEQVKSDL